MKKKIKSSDILKSHFQKLKKENTQFSIRALSNKLELSHSFLIDIFNGKRALPLKRLDDACEKLKINSEEKKILKKLLQLEKAKIQSEDLETSNSADHSGYAETEILPEGHLKILRHWWNLALLDLVACYPEKGLSETEILQKIPFAKNDFDISIAELLQYKLIRKTNQNTFVKTNEKLRLATRGPNEFLRTFYRTALKLATDELKKTTQADFDKRLITTISCSVNPDRIPLAKEKLSNALREIRDILTEGDCTDVYFLQAQMFSVLKK